MPYLLLRIGYSAIPREKTEIQSGPTKERTLVHFYGGVPLFFQFSCGSQCVGVSFVLVS